MALVDGKWQLAHESAAMAAAPSRGQLWINRSNPLIFCFDEYFSIIIAN